MVVEVWVASVPVVSRLELGVNDELVKMGIVGLMVGMTTEEGSIVVDGISDSDAVNVKETIDVGKVMEVGISSDDVDVMTMSELGDGVGV